MPVIFGIFQQFDMDLAACDLVKLEHGVWFVACNDLDIKAAVLIQCQTLCDNCISSVFWDKAEI
ncbi:hypothetical protein D3C85_1845260 [compost metagenome]